MTCLSLAPLHISPLSTCHIFRRDGATLNHLGIGFPVVKMGVRSPCSLWGCWAGLCCRCHRAPHSRQALPCPSTFDPQRPVCLASVSAPYLGLGAVGTGVLRHGTAQLLVHEHKHTATCTWGIIMCFTAFCTVRESRNVRRHQWPKWHKMSHQNVKVKRHILSVVLWCAVTALWHDDVCTRGNRAEARGGRSDVSAGQRGDWGGGTIVHRHGTEQVGQVWVCP